DFVFLADVELSPDAALLICSDGLTDLVPAETIRQIAVSHAGSPEHVVRSLIGAANQEGGRDNITAVFVEGPGFQAATARESAVAQRQRVPRRRKWLLAAAIVAAGVAGLFLGLNFDALGWLSGGSVNVLGLPAGTVVVRAND